MFRSPGGSAAPIWPAMAAIALGSVVLATIILALTLATPGGVSAQTSSGGLACGQALSGPIFDKWSAMGGAQGPLGCPSAGEMATPASPLGSAAREAAFAAATILWHASGRAPGRPLSSPAASTGCTSSTAGRAAGWACRIGPDQHP